MEIFEEKQISGKTIRIDRAMCIGSGSCVNLAPEVFQLDQDNIVTFREDPAGIDSERLIEACELCPVDALIASDDDGQIVP